MSISPQEAIEAIVKAHKELWAQEFDSFITRRVFPGVRVVTQNKQKSSEWSDAVANGAKISWVFRNGHYYARIDEHEGYLAVWRLDPDECVYEELHGAPKFIKEYSDNA